MAESLESVAVDDAAAAGHTADLPEKHADGWAAEMNPWVSNHKAVQAFAALMHMVAAGKKLAAESGSHSEDAMGVAAVVVGAIVRSVVIEPSLGVTVQGIELDVHR